MEFEDYYGVFRLPKSAPIKNVQKVFDKFIKEPDPELFDLYLRAYKVLTNPYKRARYDKTFGHLMLIEVNPEEYHNAIHYRLNSIQPYTALQTLIEKFKAWIEKKYDFDWKEAQQANYSYILENKKKDLWLLLRFPTSLSLESFGKYILRLHLVKPVS